MYSNHYPLAQATFQLLTKYESTNTIKMKQHSTLIVLSLLLTLFGCYTAGRPADCPIRTRTSQQRYLCKSPRRLQEQQRPFETVKRLGSKWTKEMKNIRVASMLIPRASLNALRNNPNIAYVEEDGLVEPDGESVPPAITKSLGDISSVFPAVPSAASCNDPNSFKVAIFDSGVEVGHPDIPCRAIDDADTNYKGISFVEGQPWNSPKDNANHGTHVFGIIGAIGGNNQGVSGMIPDSSGICYLIARVFNDEGNTQFASKVFEAVDWSISEKADVINMSSGMNRWYQSGQDSVITAYANGALAVASAGNDGSEAYHYPASFDNVLSVAATTPDGAKAHFFHKTMIWLTSLPLVWGLKPPRLTAAI